MRLRTHRTLIRARSRRRTSRHVPRPRRSIHSERPTFRHAGSPTFSRSSFLTRHSAIFRYERRCPPPWRTIGAWLWSLAGRSCQYDPAIGTGMAVNNSGAATQFAYSVVTHDGA